MFGPPGILYVYQIYGMHFCGNIVCGPEGQAAAVLLRAGQVVDGLEIARQRRPAVRRDRDLASGPAKLMQVLALDKGAYGTSVVDGSGPATLTPPAGEVGEIAAGPRVGVTSAHDVPWRFWIAGDPTVSVYRRHRSAETRDSTTTTVNVDARCVRIAVVTPTSDGNTAARIYEVEVRA